MAGDGAVDRGVLPAVTVVVVRRDQVSEVIVVLFVGVVAGLLLLVVKGLEKL